MFDDDYEDYDPEAPEGDEVEQVNTLSPTFDTEQDSGDGDSDDSSQEDDSDNVSFTGNGFECTCSGRCLCRYYEPKGVYNTDCAYCGHSLGSHRRR